MKKNVFFLLLFISIAFGSEIRWFSFEEGLKKAKQENKLILMDIYAQWCHWCNVIENTTYRDPRVISLIEKYYIPVRVDAEKRPEINKKYNQGGLPSTLILDKNGNIVWGGIYVSPDEMVNLLNYFRTLSPQEIQELVKENQKRIQRHQKRFLKKTRPKEPSQKYIKKTFKSVKLRFDWDNGGFYGHPKFPEEELPHFLMLYSLFFNNNEAQKMLDRTLEGYMKLIDPVEGGIYRYSVNEFWTEPHYEKLLKDQADLSTMFLNAYALTLNKKYLKAALSLVDFAINRLYDTRTGFFYNSQGADIIDEHGTLLMTGEEYFVLDKEEREEAIKKLGYAPNIEKVVYFRTNALISQALFYAYAFTKNPKYLNIAEEVLKNILEKGWTGKGIIYSPEIKKYFLNSNVYTLEALLTAYQITGNKQYLKKAEELFKILDKYYFSKKINLFTDMADVGLNYNRISFIDDIVTLNRRLSIAIYQLTMFTGNMDYRDTYKKIVSHLPSNINLNTAIGFMLEIYPPTVVHIIGNKKEKDKFVLSSFTAFPYWNYTQFIDKNDKELLSKLRYPVKEKTTAYLCNIDTCYLENKNAEDIRKQIFRVFSSYKNLF